MNLELLLIALAAGLAVLFVGWRIIATLRRQDCNSCGCPKPRA